MLCSKVSSMAVHEAKSNPYEARPTTAGSRFWTTRNLVVAGILTIVFVIVALPFGFVSVFDGHYDLSITVPPTDQIDSTSLLFAACWTKQDSQSAMAHGTKGSESFYSGYPSKSNTYVISVPYSGRSDSFGRITSYNQPQYLVVQYDVTKPTSKSVRKQVRIPQGRGNRSMTVTVP